MMWVVAHQYVRGLPFIPYAWSRFQPSLRTRS